MSLLIKLDYALDINRNEKRVIVDLSQGVTSPSTKKFQENKVIC